MSWSFKCLLFLSVISSNLENIQAYLLEGLEHVGSRTCRCHKRAPIVTAKLQCLAPAHPQ